MPVLFRAARGGSWRSSAPLLWKYSRDVDDRKFNMANVVCKMNVLKQYKVNEDRAS